MKVKNKNKNKLNQNTPKKTSIGNGKYSKFGNKGGGPSGSTPSEIIASAQEGREDSLNTQRVPQIKIKVYPISWKSKAFVRDYGNILILKHIEGDNIYAETLNGYPSAIFKNGKDIEFELT